MHIKDSFLIELAALETFLEFSTAAPLDVLSMVKKLIEKNTVTDAPASSNDLFLTLDSFMPKPVEIKPKEKKLRRIAYPEYAKWLEDTVNPAWLTEGEQLRRAREEKKLTRLEAAEMLGTNATTYSGWERGETPPKSQHIKAAIYRNFGVRFSKRLPLPHPGKTYYYVDENGEVAEKEK